MGPPPAGHDLPQACPAREPQELPVGSVHPGRRALRVLRRRHQHAPGAARPLRVHRGPGRPGEDDRRTQGRVRPGCGPDSPLRRQLCVAATEHPRPQRRPQLPTRHHRRTPAPFPEADLRLPPPEHADPPLPSDHAGRAPDAHRWPERPAPVSEPGDRSPVLPSRACPGGLSYFRIGVNWPRLADLFPWQYSGVQLKRTWPIAPLKDVLARRWKTLISVPPAQRASLFRETGFRKVTGQYPHLEPGKPKLSPIAKLTADDPLPHITRYGFRSLDRQWIIADTRVGDRIREPLWRAHSNRQIYLTSLLTGVIGEGPALVACSDLPDLHHFRGSFGGKDAIPLWRDRGATQANILPGLLAQLQACYKAPVNAEDFVGYCYAVVAHPAYTSLFAAELEHRQPRVPLTQDTELFKEAVSIGRRLLWLHTYGQRFAPQGTQPGDLPAGKAQW